MLWLPGFVVLLPIVLAYVIAAILLDSVTYWWGAVRRLTPSAERLRAQTHLWMRWWRVR